ncbi:cupin-like domain-containing protein [Asticcacaulis sp. 201]|uniref:cupin-like domain-containing protein n=1 Tax=Asticcacaulis sp. 201 TaxID=3028787 RepID=UPI002915F6F1|nr:cupin-like domain-containing protein [Asticcacaulis sp. 201]MDV6332673.1 cupin-like domain-containing protein [Asticcacaulis sp. 201]
MSGVIAKSRAVTGVAPDQIPYDDLMAAQAPVILKGVARDWPLVQAGLVSAQAAMDYLKGFYQGRPVTLFVAEPEVGGRFFYNDEVTGLNFQGGQSDLRDALDQISTHLDNPNPPSFYIGSTDLDLFLPGLRLHDELVLNHPMFAANPPLASIWIGNRTTATAHYDMSHNLAVCVAGRRRFTLFPPDQVHNLYPGPLEPTPGGQVLSMVDFNAPDFDRYPRFRNAQAAGQVAELEPGDVLFYPALWWHHVEALDPFNILINYWWNTSPAFMDTPQTTLLHAMLSLRDRPAPEKAAWRELFDYYVFGPAETAGAHLPEVARGNLGPMDDMKARRLRAMLLKRLNR